MTQPGGSATMYGVLYQLLGTARWAGKIHLSTSTEGGEWTEARLVIEPFGGGGDTQIESTERRIVEQWKAKSDGGAWSLRNVITDVLPDLYRAVDLVAERPETEFRFVTEGHRGRWATAEQFFADLRCSPVSDDPLAALDNKQPIKFFPDEELTKRDFFRCILGSLRTHPGIAKDSETESARKLWYLLGRFRIHGDQTIEKLTRELNGFLRPLVDYSEQVEPKRRELCAALLELASDGNATFTPRELLAKVNLDHPSFCNWARARDAILKTTQQTLRIRLRYNAEADVRSPMSPPANSGVCVLTGESGQGKTWRLASLALDAFADGSIAVAVSTSRNAEQDLQNAANVVWRDGFQREGPTDLDLVARKRHEFLPGLPTPWLTICVDDVQSMAEARSLIKQDWRGFGIRLAMTVLPPVAQALKTQYGEEISIVEVDDFSTLELRHFLEANGHNWGVLPGDVREVLCKPLLAQLYCDIAEAGDWHPTNEYALFARYWQRIIVDRNQADHPADIEAMRQLASTFLDGDVVYPWPQSLCITCGVSAEVQTRLESVGWLRRVEDNRIEVVHDRLLNWAVADALVAKRVSHKLSASDIAEKVSRFFGPHSSGRMLGYVPMDVCWLMSEPSMNLADELPGLIAALEDGASIWHSGGLYKDLLPTLGPRIIEPMVERVRAAVGEDEAPEESNLLSRFLSDAIVEIGKQHPNDAIEWGLRLLDDDSAMIRQGGLRVLKHYPSVAALDKLWELHKNNYEGYVRKEEKHWWLGYGHTFSALNSCVRLDPEWLERRILECSDDTGPFSELAYLVAVIPGVEGAALWNRVKNALFAKVPTDKGRCLVVCIQQHADHTEISRLESWLDQGDDLTGETALTALVHLDPKRALCSLCRFDVNRLYMMRKWWRPGLLLRFPDQTRDQIREIIETSAEARWRGALVYQDDPNQMDERTLNLLLDELEVLARDAISQSETRDKNKGLWVPLNLLADVTRLDLLSQFEKRAGTPLEQVLTDLACSWGGRMTGYVDHELEYATHVLKKIGGDGFTKLVNRQLSSESKYARLDGIRLSLVRPDSETRQLLTDITRSPDVWDKERGFPLLQAKAAVALAALGENRAVVDAIVCWGKVLTELPDMREGQPPMTDDDLAGAMEALAGSDEKKKTNAVFALSVSGRIDFAPRIRQVLEDTEPESKLAQAAVVALGHFEDTHPDAMTLLEAQLQIPGHAHAASLALLRNGKRESLAILERELRRRGIVRGLATSDLLAVNLGRQQETRKAVAEVLWNSIREGGKQWFGPIPGLDCLVEIDTPEVREFLVEQSHAPEQVFHIAGQKAAAIRALAKVDRDSAFRAVETALCVDRKDLELYPGMLMEIDEARAIPVLLDAYSRSLRTLTKWAVGRALRHASDRTMIHRMLNQMMHAESPETRVIGVDLGSWQPPSVFDNRIRQIAVEDSVTDVRQKAEKSVAFVERQQFAIELLQILEKTHGSRCWSYLEAVVELCDPWLLTTRNDPLFLWGRLSGKPPGLKKHASELIKKRMGSLKEEAEKADRDVND